MKKQRLKKYEELSEVDKQVLIGSIRSFIFNHSIKETKNQLWKFYRNWVCNGAKVASPNAHEDNILFYDNLMNLLKSCSGQLKISNKLKKD